MPRSVKNLKGYTVRATDGEIGSADDLYFDDQSWRLRYVVVATGVWLSGRKVLISPESFAQPDWMHRVLSVAVTKDQVERSPEQDFESALNREHEIAHYNHYGYTPIGRRI